MNDDTATQLRRLWDVAKRQLGTARDALTNPDDNALVLYEDFLDHNELGLALDALVDVAHAQRAPDLVWRSLAGAAETMHLHLGDDSYGATVRRILDHLHAAHEARGLQRLLNEWDPIGVSPDVGDAGDEYACLNAPLLKRLAEGQSAKKIAVFLHRELEDHFGIDATQSRPDVFAVRLVDWFQGGAPA